MKQCLYALRRGDFNYIESYGNKAGFSTNYLEFRIVETEIIDKNLSSITVKTIFKDIATGKHYKILEIFGSEKERKIVGIIEVCSQDGKWIQKLPDCLEDIYNNEYDIQNVDFNDNLINLWCENLLKIEEEKITDVDENEYTKEIVISIKDKYFLLEIVVPFDDNSYVINIIEVFPQIRTVQIFE